MNDYTATREADATAATAIVKPRPGLPVVWVVPLITALVAGYLVYQRVQRVGPHITIRFKDGNGLKPGHSPIKYRGVTIGEVRSISLSPDLNSVLVAARLDKSAAAMAREGTVFWIVRPELGVGSITGLGTIISGPYIEVLPGAGAEKQSFEGAATFPTNLEEKGLRIVLVSPRRGSLRAGSPLYFRGIEVGAVRDHQLSGDARLVEFDVFIQQRYAPLVRRESKFWNVSGVDVDFSLFKGAQINVESLKALVSGGLTFATPEAGKGDQTIADGARFHLFDEPKKDWLEWSPAIPIPGKTATE